MCVCVCVWCLERPHLLGVQSWRQRHQPRLVQVRGVTDLGQLLGALEVLEREQEPELQHGVGVENLSR